MSPKVIGSVTQYSDGELQNMVGLVVAKMTSNPYFSAEWPPQVPQLVAIDKDLTLFRNLCVECTSGDRAKIREHDEVRGRLEIAMPKVARYVELVADGDEKILSSTGFPLRSPRTNSAGTSLLPAPTDFRVTYGRLSGTLDVHVRRLEGASFYDVQTMPGNGNADTDWKHATSSPTSMHIQVEGLTPGQYVWVRVRGVNSAGNGLWTEPIKIMVV
ncbi:MAG: hypothetical protein AB3X44_19230 [Leptothrix sp. (in: b-proteobacteria)]